MMFDDPCFLGTHCSNEATTHSGEVTLHFHEETPSHQAMQVSVTLHYNGPTLHSNSRHQWWGWLWGLAWEKISRLVYGAAALLVVGETLTLRLVLSTKESMLVTQAQVSIHSAAGQRSRLKKVFLERQAVQDSDSADSWWPA
eukprot:CAMPEP_0114559072 /NCGR_PEP_ID=MMETSP0114-20121206/10729_1 /TAXON_ID=31324 /ORGANISM="Goniomonas sp, Strain m" /LENGTH=141 /DNA_ID=CAMNT_0001744523 /DNA_START=320 /DNA_END=745 /DNA_ORIENTATION=-